MTLRSFSRPIVILFCLILLRAPCGIAQDDPPLSMSRIWGRDGVKTAMVPDDTVDGGVRIDVTGERDWAVSLHKPLPVTAGERWHLEGRLQDKKGEGRVELAAAIYGNDGKIINWQHAVDIERGDHAGRLMSCDFTIPHGAATLEPRLTGVGTAALRFAVPKLNRTGNTELIMPTLVVPPVGDGELQMPIKANAWQPMLFGDGMHKVTVDPFHPQSIVGEFKTEGRWELAPCEPIIAKPGDKLFVSLRLKLDKGGAELEVFPWIGGLRGGSAKMYGTFKPSLAEEGNDWSCIHAYVTVPDGVEGILPVIKGDNEAQFRIAELSIRRPTAAELMSVPRKVAGFAQQRIEEKCDRAPIALRANEGVYLSWRLLKTDSRDLGFHVYRFDGDGREVRLTSTPITKTCDFLDHDVPNDSGYRWVIEEATAAKKRTTPVAACEKPYLSLRLPEEMTVMRVGLADLDGDGRLDYILKSPNSNIDPYINYWKPSHGTYQLHAFNADGQPLWQYDLGWGIEQGIWYSPYLVADLDGDGRAEVIVKTGGDGDPRNLSGHVYSGPEYLSILDGLTGKERCRVDWPERDGLGYNYSSRNQLCLAYLDGKTPCLIALRGTYTRMVAVAYQFHDNRLEEFWRWDNRWQRGRWGQGAHTTHAFDVDGDGRDEVILGSIVLDDDGSVLWETQLGHPDHVYVGDLDPDRSGLEILYGIETRQPKNGICMVDAKTGAILWGHDKPTTHIHSQGMCADIDPRFPGCESWAGERDDDEQRWFRDASGRIIDRPSGFSGKSNVVSTVWWDADLQRELIVGGRPVDFPSLKQVDGTKFEGSIRFVADICGDWREEVIVSLPGELRIYTTTIPANDRRTTLFQDANYRATLFESTMGYPQTPLPGYDLAAPTKP